MEQKKVIGYMRVSSREQNEDRQRIALLEMGVPEEDVYSKDAGILILSYIYNWLNLDFLYRLSQL